MWNPLGLRRTEKRTEASGGETKISLDESIFNFAKRYPSYFMYMYVYFVTLINDYFSRERTTFSLLVLSLSLFLSIPFIM